MDASWLKLISLEKIVMNIPWPFEVSSKEGGHPKRYEEMVGLCEFRGFLALQS